jgi:hypothetical protein
VPGEVIVDPAAKAVDDPVVVILRHRPGQTREAGIDVLARC